MKIDSYFNCIYMKKYQVGYFIYKNLIYLLIKNVYN